MKRIPTDNMEVIITEDGSAILRCALGQRKETLYSRDAERQFAFLEGDGALIRMTAMCPSEAEFTNQLLEYFGSDRRWMEVSGI